MTGAESRQIWDERWPLLQPPFPRSRPREFAKYSYSSLGGLMDDKRQRWLGETELP